MQYFNLIVGVIFLVITSCNSEKESSQSIGKEGPRHAQTTTEKPAETFDNEEMAFIKQLVKNYKKSDENIDGQRIYRERCAVCHGVKGDLGVAGAGDLTKSRLDLSQRVATIYYGKNTMTPFKDVLSEAEIVEVALFIALLRQP